MDPVHILMDPVTGPGPWRGSMDQGSMFCTFSYFATAREEKEKPVMGITEPLLGIAKPTERLNKPCQGNVNGKKIFRREGFNVKIPFISQTYTKAVAISFRQSQSRARNLVKYHLRVIFAESFYAVVSTDEDVCSPCER